MEETPKFRIDSEQKKMYFNGNFISLDNSLYNTNKINSGKGIRLDYKFDSSLDIINETERVSKFFEENSLDKILNIHCYEFPNKTIIITKNNSTISNQ